MWFQPLYPTLPRRFVRWTRTHDLQFWVGLAAVVATIAQVVVFLVAWAPDPDTGQREPWRFGALFGFIGPAVLIILAMVLTKSYKKGDFFLFVSDGADELQGCLEIWKRLPRSDHEAMRPVIEAAYAAGRRNDKPEIETRLELFRALEKEIEKETVTAKSEALDLAAARDLIEMHQIQNRGAAEVREITEHVRKENRG